MKSLFTLLPEIKVIRDPIHNYIPFRYQIAWDLLNCREFQRLRRIHQLSGKYFIFPSAEHSRFNHCLGAYALAHKWIQEIDGLVDHLTEHQQLVLVLSALLHDIGHGPFSHTFEAVSRIPHEQFSQEIVLGDTEIQRVFASYTPNIAEEVAAVLGKKHANPLLNQIISSELDVDRMDYLLRDSYFCGVSYGTYDCSRILRTLRVHNQSIVVKATGVGAVEDYLIARYQMFHQVYNSKNFLCYEAVFINLIKRLRYLLRTQPNYFQELPLLVPLLEQRLTLETYLQLDEYVFHHFFLTIMQKDDQIAARLANGLVNRHLFRLWPHDERSSEQILSELSQQGYNLEYYTMCVRYNHNVYQIKDSESLYVLQENGKLIDMRQASNLLRILLEGESPVEELILYFPGGIDE